MARVYRVRGAWGWVRLFRDTGRIPGIFLGQLILPWHSSHGQYDVETFSRTQTFSPLGNSSFLPPPALVALRWIWEQVGPWVARMGQRPIPNRNWWILITLFRRPVGPWASTGQRCSNIAAATILSLKSCRRCGRDEIPLWSLGQKPKVISVFYHLPLAFHPMLAALPRNSLIVLPR